MVRILLLHDKMMTMTMKEARGIQTDKRNTGTFDDGHQNCVVVVVVVHYQMQTLQLQTDAAGETAGTMTIPNTMSTQPCVCSHQRALNPHVQHLTRLQPRRSLNALMAPSAAMWQSKSPVRRTNCHQRCIRSQCTGDPVMPHTQPQVPRHSQLDLPLQLTTNKMSSQFNHCSTSAMRNMHTRTNSCLQQ